MRREGERDVNLLARKSIERLLSQAEDESGLKRALGPWHLILLGIGAIIGAGIFVITGTAAAQYAGPAIVISFIVAGIACAFSGLCYAEFASLIPIAGSAYTYGYATLGEIFAWIIGWDLILEYAFGASTVAVGWAANVISFLQDLGINIPPALTQSPNTVLVMYQNKWQVVESVEQTLTKAGVDINSLPHATGSFNLIAVIGVLVVSAILVIGIRESANLNALIVVIKISVVLVFIGLAAATLSKLEWAPLQQNWHPFIPPNTGKFGEYGWSGIFRAAAVVFFAYIGFDAVSTAAQEARDPQKDMPIGIMGSLGICTILYIVVAGLLTGLVPYKELNVAAPIALAIDRTGVVWGSFLVKLGTIAGLGSVMLVMLLGQSRVLFSMSNDGLLPEWCGRIHPKFRTPYISTIVVGLFVAVFAGLFPMSLLGELVSIGTLLAFVIVCAGVWVLRVREPDRPRAFKTPLVPLVPILGIVTALAMMVSLPPDTWIRLVVWLIIGMVIYFSYSRNHSQVQREAAASQGSESSRMA
ncbi:MAG: amino acid permease [Candidatus Xenobia bacterium]